MSRFALVLALVSALVMTAALPAGAAPARTGTPLDLDCGAGGAVSVLVQFESNASAVFDLADGNGRRYVLSELDFRVYAGAWDRGDEGGAGDPVFAEMKTWGNRTGYGERLDCSGWIVQEYPEGIFTSFFDVALSGK